ncbi:glycosyl transferase [Paenibacillus sp. Sa2BVA9]|uniref:Glycosyl transferase n=2 Tax=Paenibacillus gallinarum TaxID=2762232 RepID=A0ABR8T5M1_9BACL|nr:glycosyl transferase [Paenibacillus gallinarum]
MFYACCRKKLDFEDPKLFNEKLQYLKLYDRKPEYTNYVDKFEVRKYIKRVIGDDYLIPLIGVYNNFDEINFEKLPDKFVLKCTHDSGGVIICEDKNKFNQFQAKKTINSHLKKNYFYYGREWPYKNIPPRIICEQFIETPDGKAPTDYKFMCFNGQPEYIQVHTDRFGPMYTKDYYDINWKKTNIRQGVPNSDMILPRPKNLGVMIDIAKKLSEKIPHSRIDLYEQDGKIYFGEITLYPNSGFKNFINEDDDYLMGQLIQLP